MRKFERYTLRDLSIACAFITATLAAVVFLTQSLRFLELVINSGASSSTFWVLTFLALPRFFEIILPLSVMAAVIFVFHRMALDSEIVALKASGFSPFAIGKPALILGLAVTLFLWIMTLWLAPVSLNKMQKMQQVVKAQISSYLFREGVFNSLGNGITFYIRERANDGTLKGLLIHDNRKDQPLPATITAKEGNIIGSEDGYQITVYNGSRQVFDPEKKTLQRLNFERYNIKIPDSSPIRQRWREPDERTIFELINPDPNLKRDRESARDFTVEIHKRISAPLLALTFTLIASCCLLLGPVTRYGHSRKILLAISACVLIQGLYIAAFNLARQNDIGFVIMYALIILPCLSCGFLLSTSGESVRRALFYKRKEQTP